MYENSDSFRSDVDRARRRQSDADVRAGDDTITPGYEFLRDRRIADRGITSFQGRPADVADRHVLRQPGRQPRRADVNLASAGVEHRIGRVTLRNRTLVGNYDRFYQNFVPGAVIADSRRWRSPPTTTPRAHERVQPDRRDVRRLRPAASDTRCWRRRTRPPVDGQLPQHRVLQQHRHVDPRFRSRRRRSRRRSRSVRTRPMPTTICGHRGGGVRAGSGRAFAASAGARRRALRSFRSALSQQPQRRHLAASRQPGLAARRHRGQADAGVAVRELQRVVSPEFRRPVLIPDRHHAAGRAGEIHELRGRREMGLAAGLSSRPRSTGWIAPTPERPTRTIPTRIVQTGSQRTNGFELGVNGSVTPRLERSPAATPIRTHSSRSATAAARAGAIVGAGAAQHVLALEQLSSCMPRLSASASASLHRVDMFADHRQHRGPARLHPRGCRGVRPLSRDVRLQLNVENLFDADYYTNADSNTNISFGFPRAVRVGVTTAF